MRRRGTGRSATHVGSEGRKSASMMTGVPACFTERRVVLVLPCPVYRVARARNGARRPHKNGMAKRAACVFLTNAEGHVLTVSRRTDEGDVGLPGGAAEPGEPLNVAAAREVEEETGLVVALDDLVPVFVADGGTGAPAITTCSCTTFVAARWSGTVRREAGGGRVAWLPPASLVAPGCSFGAYNAGLLAHLASERARHSSAA
jgi:8-oxo-dGTP pyrophosphatase MutT (NUDIX family)